MTRNKNLLLGLLAVIGLWIGISLPHLIPWPKTKADWEYFVPAANFDDELFYVAQLNHFIDSKAVPGNAYLKEHLHDPPFEPPFNEVLLAFLNWPWGHLYRLVYLWTALLFSVGLVFLSYRLLTRMGVRDHSRWVGVAFIAISLSENLNRMIHPQADAFIFLLGTFLALREAIAGGNKKAWALAAGIGAAAIGYLYPFYGLYVDIFILLLFLIQSAEEKKMSYPLLVAGFVCFILSLGFLHHNLAARSLPQYQEILTRNGFLHSHIPSLTPTAILLAGLALSTALPKKTRSFYQAALFAGLLCVNSHVLTGLYFPMTDDHFHHAYRLPLALEITVLLDVYIDDMRRIGWAAVFLFIFLFGIMQFNITLNPRRRDLATVTSDYKGVFDWAAQNTPPASVFASSNPGASLINAFSPEYSLTGVYTYVSIVPKKELQERMFDDLHFFKMTPKDLELYCLNHALDFWGYAPTSKHERARAHDRLRRILHWPSRGSVPVLISTEKRERLVASYKNYCVSADQNRFEADYLLFGPFERADFPFFNPSNGSYQMVFKKGAVSLWKIPNHD